MNVGDKVRIRRLKDLCCAYPIEPEYMQALVETQYCGKPGVIIEVIHYYPRSVYRVAVFVEGLPKYDVAQGFVESYI